MIDFTNCKEEYKKYYDGLNGKKKSIYYNDELYMLKFPKESNPDNDSYASGTINEHISSNIFKILGFKTQDTLLGYYQDKVVVACKDFEHFKNQLFSFGKIKNSVFDTKSSNSNSDTELYETLHTIENQKAIPPTLLKDFFWEMFVADTLIANFDRHNGNWGFLSSKNGIDIAPIYDCGSSLYPKLSIDDIKRYLAHKGSFNDLMLNQTTSAITIQGKKINPQDFLKETKNDSLVNALQKVLLRIDNQKINSLIDSVEIISDTRKEFYKLILEKRKLFLQQVLIAKQPHRKVLRDDLNKYQLVGSGIEPHIKRINNAALPAVPSPTNLGNNTTTIFKSQATVSNQTKPKTRKHR